MGSGLGRVTGKKAGPQCCRERERKALCLKSRGQVGQKYSGYGWNPGRVLEGGYPQWTDGEAGSEGPPSWSVVGVGFEVRTASFAFQTWFLLSAVPLTAIPWALGFAFVQWDSEGG